MQTKFPIGTLLLSDYVGIGVVINRVGKSYEVVWAEREDRGWHDQQDVEVLSEVFKLAKKYNTQITK